MKKPKDVMLFGRRMRQSAQGGKYRLGDVTLEESLDVRHRSMGWQSYHWAFGWSEELSASPHAAARALERKIVAAHRRLGKLIEGKK